MLKRTQVALIPRNLPASPRGPGWLERPCYETRRRAQALLCLKQGGGAQTCLICNHRGRHSRWRVQQVQMCGVKRQRDSNKEIRGPERVMHLDLSSEEEGRKGEGGRTQSCRLFWECGLPCTAAGVVVVPDGGEGAQSPWELGGAEAGSQVSVCLGSTPPPPQACSGAFLFFPNLSHPRRGLGAGLRHPRRLSKTNPSYRD